MSHNFVRTITSLCRLTEIVHLKSSHRKHNAQRPVICHMHSDNHSLLNFVVAKLFFFAFSLRTRYRCFVLIFKKKNRIRSNSDGNIVFILFVLLEFGLDNTGRLCKMLRNQRHENRLYLRRQNCTEETDGQAGPTRENDARNCHPQVIESSEYCAIFALFR